MADIQYIACNTAIDRSMQFFRRDSPPRPSMFRAMRVSYSPVVEEALRHFTEVKVQIP